MCQTNTTSTSDSNRQAPPVRSSSPTASTASTTSSSSSFLLELESSPSTWKTSPWLRQLATTLACLTGGILTGCLCILFALRFPFWLAPSAAERTYQAAFYQYNAELSLFDNTVWTYGTDYALAVVMTYIAQRRVTQSNIGRGLFYMYALSVTCGGLAHQFYTELEQRNTWTFRLLWTICVGSVTAASGFMGSLATELLDREKEIHKEQHCHILPRVPHSFWIAYGTTTTLVCLVGGISFQRPACDIFIAGITQSPTTFYMMALLYFNFPALSNLSRWMGIVGFILNAPLLPMYPLLVQYTTLSLGAVNALLHSWLLMGWGSQGFSVQAMELCQQQQRYKPKSI